MSSANEEESEKTEVDDKRVEKTSVDEPIIEGIERPIEVESLCMRCMENVSLRERVG
jgi:hypothetical protein